MLFPLSAPCAPAQPRTDLLTLGTAQPPPPGFTHLPYANPAAPKGGTLTEPGQGDFDNFNPFIVRGTVPPTVFLVWQTLFKLSDTDSVTEYADLAQAVHVRGNTVTFDLNPAARFSDGTPVTAADVVWTFHTLIDEGAPYFATEYAGVAAAAAPNPTTVVFTLKPGAGPDTAFNLGGLYVLPAHFWAHRDFATPLRAFPVGSGAYRVSHVAWGSEITYTHVPRWWAADLPAEKGFDNFTTITQLFFQEKSALIQAFRAGELDVQREGSATLWATAYRFRAVREGKVKLQLAPMTLPTGMYGLVMNTRRLVFADRRVREALTLAYDFQWANRALFYGDYQRDTSYFMNTPLAASGLPSPAERQLLAPYRGSIPPAVFTTPFALPVTDGSGYNLAQLEQAMTLLNEAGWRVQHFKLVNAQGQQMKFQILLDDPQFARIAIPYAADLKLLGIDASIRTIDEATYQRDENDFDFDMTVGVFPISAYPGPEQGDYWGCAAAHSPGSNNLAGVCTPAIDAMINAEIAARDPQEKQTAIRALDRLLLNGWYVVPWFHADIVRLAWWQDRVAKPDSPLQVGVDFSRWWAK